MKREIKLKAWLPNEKKMTKSHSIKDIVSVCSLGYPDSAQWLQWTGLKDKNGKDIFEGDIIACDNYKMYGGKYPVSYDEDLGMFVTKLANIQETALYKHRGIEVIGNIYDNPKLLTA